MRIQPGQKLSHYRLQQRIGAGGMGEVWLSVDEALGRDAAIKVLPEKFSPALSGRLLREAEACARLQHPAIATFFEADVVDGTSFIAMEYVRGETLRVKLKGGPVPQVEALDLVTGLLEALGHAHSSGILHRDIKPENIMVTDEGLPRLLDFGLAKHLWSDGSEAVPTEPTMTMLTAPGTLLGTVGYMSPEQLRGEPLDVRSDLFAVAVVLYELLCGKPAFPGATPTEKLSVILSRDPDPLDPAVVSPALDTFVRRCLSRDRERRPASAGDFMRGLRRSREGLPSAAGLAPSVALLDLQNLSGNTDDDWVATGTAESLAADLAQVEGLKVFPMQASRRAAAAVSEADPLQHAGQVALRLGARWVVCGSFQKIGSRLRIISHLVEALTGETVATEKLDGAIDNMFEFQDRLAQAIVSHLDLSTPAAAATQERKFDVFELYARAERFMETAGKESMTRAGELLESVLEVEPDHVPALTNLARMWGMKYVYTSDPEFPRRAIEYANRALAVDPDSVQTLVWRGYALFQTGKYEEASRNFSRALEIAPGDYMAAYFCASHFVFPSHASETHRLQRQEPSHASAEKNRSLRMEEAVRLLQIAVQDPRTNGFNWLALGVC
ncbi:MAG: protein kinase, partial [Planctomycetota bacterium]